MRGTLRRVPAGGLARAAICIVLLIDSAGATSVLVPDDYPTIQQAIDSGADTVRVREGRYEEDLVATGDLTLLAYDSQVGMGSRLDAPVVGGLQASADLVATGIRFAGAVSLGPFTAGSPFCRFEGCRFDGPLHVPHQMVAFLYVRGCTFLADVYVRPYSCEFVNNAFIGAHLDVAHDGFANHIGNVFVGPGDVGIRSLGWNEGLVIAGNVISGRKEGIVIRQPTSSHVLDNDVHDCEGTAFRIEAEEIPPGRIWLENNRVSDCGGVGFDLTNIGGSVVGNTVERVGGDGIRASGFALDQIRGNEIRVTGGRGISADIVASRLSQNIIVDTGSDGVVCNYAARVDSNVIGRAQGKGLWLTTSGGSRIRHNTIYACASDGFTIPGTSFAPDSLTANIAYANGGAGLVVTGPVTPALSCNDWQANSGGATVGIAPGPTDLALDPLFCNVVEDDVSLTSASPLLNAPGCGQIGALGQGCEISISGPLGARPAAESFRVFPQPALDRVTFAWLSGGGPARLEVFDVTGARRWQAEASAGTAEMSWSLRGIDGARLPAGVYWARLTRNGEAMHSRIVRIR